MTRVGANYSVRACLLYIIYFHYNVRSRSEYLLSTCFHSRIFFDKDKDYFIGKRQSKISNPIKLHAEYMVFKWDFFLRTYAQTCHTITGISKIKLDKIGLKTSTDKKKKTTLFKINTLFIASVKNTSLYIFAYIIYLIL